MPQTKTPSRAKNASTRGETAQRIGVDLMERLDFSTSNVDRENCVIKNVKILGAKSHNRHGMDVEGTDYLPSAHAQARKLYEGAHVNMGHPPRNDPDRERDPDDRNGVLYGIQTINNQTYGNWKLIPSHPMTPRILDCAEDPQLHDQFALSHNAKGYGQVREGRYQISEIPLVRSVDLVCSGGTNKSLFESRETMATTTKKKFREVLESALESTRDRFKPILDLYEDLGDMPADPVAAPPADDADASSTDYMNHLGEMVKAIVADESMSPDEKRDKILAAIKVMEEKKEAPASADTEEGDENEEDDANAMEADECGEGKGKRPGDKLESREKLELAQLRAEKNVRNLCESLEFQPTGVQMKALVALTSDSDRRSFIKEAKGMKTVPAKKPLTQPRTATSRGRDVQESRNTVGANGTREVDFTDTSDEGRRARANYLKA